MFLSSSFFRSSCCLPVFLSPSRQRAQHLHRTIDIMFSKSSHCPAIAVAVTVALLLVTFWRSNMGAPYLVHGNDAAKLAAAKSASKSGSSSNKDKDKPRYIFVDLGANAADSLEAFLKHPNAKFEYDFPAPKWAKHEDAGKSPATNSL